MLIRGVRGVRSMLRLLFHVFFSRQAIPLWILFFGASIEVYMHAQHIAVARPERNLDEPFAAGCQNVTLNAAGPRENGVLVMLVRNTDLEHALHTIRSIEHHFNQWFGYPYVFLNNERWSDEFMTIMNATVSSEASFEVLPPNTWGFPEFIDKEAAMASIAEQGSHGQWSKANKAGIESYHHMCRFFSGNFFMLDALKKYKWYWRIEPDIDLFCDLTYDPFVEMSKRGKLYGFTISLWEDSYTAKSLFKEVNDYKEKNHFPTTELWKAMISPSWLPWPFRGMAAGGDHTDFSGDSWNQCHYWSNFEIADLDFFRSKAYQNLYERLDRKGGFYFERWGDAPIHSLAVAMLADSTKIHHFEDIGYRHGWLWQCPANAPGGQMHSVEALGNGPYSPARDGGVGCRCICDGRKRANHPSYCLNRLKTPNTPTRPAISNIGLDRLL